MNRRQFIRNTGLSLGAIFISDAILAGVYDHAAINYPDAVTAIIDNELVQLSGNGQQHWVYRNLLVDLKYKNQSLEVAITAPQCSLSAVTLHWKKTAQPTAVMNDHWERTYGDASWHAPAAAEMLPWYFMEQSENATHGFGVKTGTATFCSWQRTPAELRLTMDTRSGGDGVQLGNRQLLAAAIVTIKSHPHETAFAVARRFTKMMCAAANMPKKPVYGINDWYFTYGNNSEKLILEHTRLMAPMADGLENRPFSVIDAGWFVGPPSSPNDCCWGDRMDLANARFGGDMSKSAVNIKQAGMRPGIWTRPLCGSYQDPANIMLPMIKGREQNKPVLDPSIPENLERIKKYFRNYNEWGFEMVKFDFTTFDILGKWGFEMLHSCAMTSNNWRMQDNTKTNAEIILKMYTSIRETSLYYLTIEEFATKRATLTNEGVRVSGRVGAGSMTWSPKDLHLQFLLSSFKEGEPIQGVPVRYQGILPDMFAEGRDVIVEGLYSHENILEAKTIMTSCPSKYEAEKSGVRVQGSEIGEKKTVN